MVSLVEVRIASALLAVGLIGIMSAIPAAYVDVVASGGESKAAAAASIPSRRAEELRS